MGRQFLAICRTVTEVRAYEEASGNGEWPIWVGSSGLWSCLETRQGRGARGSGNLWLQEFHSLVKG